MPSVAFVMGLGVHACLERRSKRVALMLFLLLVIPATVSLDALVHLIRTEQSAAELVETQITGIEQVLLEAPDDSLVLVVGTRSSRGGVPMVGYNVPLAFKPPFRSEERSIVHVLSTLQLLQSSVLTRFQGQRQGRFFYGVRIVNIQQ